MSGLTPVEIEYMKAHASDNISTPHIIGNIVCMVVSLIAVVLRVLSRWGIGRKLAMADWLMVIAVALVTGHCANNAVMFGKLGLGRHVIFVPNARSFALHVIAGQLLYNNSVLIIKLSVLSFYSRIFPQQWFGRLLIALAVLITLYVISQSIAQCLQCVPLRALWDRTVKHSRCINLRVLLIIHGVINIGTDFITVGLPLPVLWSLPVSNGYRERIILVLMFSFGFLICIISIVRIVYLPMNSHDPTWDFSKTATLSSAELGGATLAACVPTYRPIYNFLRYGTFTAPSEQTNAKRRADPNCNLRYPLQSVTNPNRVDSFPVLCEQYVYDASQETTHGSQNKKLSYG